MRIWRNVDDAESSATAKFRPDKQAAHVALPHMILKLAGRVGSQAQFLPHIIKVWKCDGIVIQLENIYQ